MARKRRYFKAYPTLGTLEGEAIPLAALKERRNLSLKVQVFLEFIDAVSRGKI